MNHTCEDSTHKQNLFFFIKLMRDDGLFFIVPKKV